LKLLRAVYHYWPLVFVGVLVGALVALAWTYQITWVGMEPEFSTRWPAVYSTEVDVVIDTTQFGIGRSDTDMYKLSLMAPAYAQLMTSQQVQKRAESILSAPIDAQLTAVARPDVPVVALTVSGNDPGRLRPIAVALVKALEQYITDGQVASRVPANVALTVRGMGEPSTPEVVSNRRIEIAVILWCLPIVVALVLAYRLEYSEARGSGNKAISHAAASSAVSEEQLERAVPNGTAEG
jgi:hypothetical protein